MPAAGCFVRTRQWPGARRKRVLRGQCGNLLHGEALGRGRRLRGGFYDLSPVSVNHEKRDEEESGISNNPAGAVYDRIGVGSPWSVADGGRRPTFAESLRLLYRRVTQTGPNLGANSGNLRRGTGPGAAE